MFKRTVMSTALLVALTALSAFADPKDDLQAAVKKVADSPSYSWSTTANTGFGGPQTTTGKTEKDGYSMVSLPGANGNTEAYLKGKAAVVKTDAGWQTVDEAITAMTAGGGRGRGRGGFALFQLQDFQPPATAALDLIPKLENVKKTDTGFTGDLTVDSAKTMMAFRGRGRGGAAAGGGAPPAPEITNPKGTVKVDVKDGAVSKVEYHVTGNMSFNGNAIDIDRTTTTEIKDVGSTKVTVPDDAKKKLDEAK
jgi:hypothetical protein